ncbi:MAG: hypothetical protein ACTHK1_13425 [Actinomycetales bacterium]
MRRVGRALLALAATAGMVTGTTGLAEASTLPPPRHLTVTMSDSAIRLSTHSIHAGYANITVKVTSGDHTLQLLKVYPHYGLAQAKRDIATLDSPKPNLAAIRRIDRGIHFLGGAEATAGHNALFGETLYQGTYYLIDQNGPAMTTLRVYGAVDHRAAPKLSGVVTAWGEDRFGGTTTLSRDGWVLFKNLTDEPHFLVFQHVKPGTTARQVKAALAAPNEPDFILDGGGSTGVISANTAQYFHLYAPAGEYVMLCFWPSDENGMPHAMMGMWRIVTVK